MEQPYGFLKEGDPAANQRCGHNPEGDDGEIIVADIPAGQGAEQEQAAAEPATVTPLQNRRKGRPVACVLPSGKVGKGGQGHGGTRLLEPPGRVDIPGI
ncbi:hypothetical protein M5E06_30865 [Azospirillum sp. A1-3]|uniref:hypothetical protein n=1 Tax=Azospirillum sp. A1-3 TaxID=185874 RepID=UPI002076D97D|nr:hypothetical protein [Azospirillum sp. A1-3]MCM8738529.1 hypothetical protein [Azospirillum sp. A1-3]